MNTILVTFPQEFACAIRTVRKITPHLLVAMIVPIQIAAYAKGSRPKSGRITLGSNRSAQMHSKRPHQMEKEAHKKAQHEQGHYSMPALNLNIK